MCYILYGAVNKEINREDYERVTAKYPYHIRPGTRHDVKMCLLKDDYTYRVTDWVCDCKFPLGMKDPKNPELKLLAQYIEELRTVPHAKYVYLCKGWNGRRCKSEANVSADSCDLPTFLANAECGCLYRIEMKEKEDYQPWTKEFFALCCQP